MFITEPVAPPASVADVAHRLLAELSPYSDCGLVSVDAESDCVANVQTEVSIRLDPAFAADEHNWEFVYSTTNDVLRDLGLSDQVPFLMTMQRQHQPAAPGRQEVMAL